MATVIQSNPIPATRPPWHIQPPSLAGWLALAATVLIIKVTVGVVGGYASYFPPDFGAGFLRGRESYFFGSYRWAFTTHIIAGPLTLGFGLLLLSTSVRRSWPAAHRVLGRVQVFLVALVLAPSGLIMAFRAAAGPVAGVGLGVLALLTAATALLGARRAVQQRYAEHRRWMGRCFVLLASAVVLRLIVGLAVVLGQTAAWVDPLATWLCWLGPLAVFEIAERSPGRPPSFLRPARKLMAYPHHFPALPPSVIDTIARRSANDSVRLRKRTSPLTKAVFVPPT